MCVSVFVCKCAVKVDYKRLNNKMCIFFVASVGFCAFTALKTNWCHTKVNYIGIMTLRILCMDTIKVFTFIHNTISLIKCIHFCFYTKVGMDQNGDNIYSSTLSWKNWISFISIDHRKENKLRGLNTEIDDHLKHIKLSNMIIMRWVYSPMGNNNHVETIHFH